MCLLHLILLPALLEVGMMITPFNRWKAWSTGKINLPKATQLLSGRTRIPTRWPGSRAHVHMWWQKPHSKKEVISYYSARKSNESLPYATWINLKNSTLSKTRHEYDSIEIFKKSESINNDENYISSCLGPRVETEIDRKEVQGNHLGDKGMFYILIVVLVTQVYIFANTHWT